MTAETAYHVIRALPKNEIPRLYKMLGVDSSEKKESIKKKKEMIIIIQWIIKI